MSEVLYQVMVGPNRGIGFNSLQEARDWCKSENAHPDTQIKQVGPGSLILYHNVYEEGKER